MLYGVDEAHILRHWSIETINRKLRNGVAFDLLRRGFAAASEADEDPITADQERELYGVYL